jgi:hypothetical protein
MYPKFNKRAYPRFNKQRRWLVILTTSSLFLALAGPGLGGSALAARPAQAGRAPRISLQALRGEPMIAVGRAPRVPAGDRAIGASAAGVAETGAIALRPRDETTLMRFVADVTNKDSAAYHHYLARGEFAHRFGPTSAAVALVKEAVTAEGLRVARVSRDGLLVTFRGSAREVEHAFRIGLERYQIADGGIGQGTIGAPRVPAAVARFVAGVVGLDNLTRERPADVRSGGGAQRHGFPSAKAAKVPHIVGAPSACPEAQEAATTEGGLTDAAIANSYGAFGMYAGGDFGQGQRVAIFELEPFLNTDIEHFDRCYFGAAAAKAMAGVDGRIAGSRLSLTSVDGGELQPGSGSDNLEDNVDIEDVSALAPQAKIDVYEAPNNSIGALDEYSAIVNADIDQVVSSSWANCEQLTQLAEPGTQEAENFLFQQAAAQGQTVLSAAGDTGDDGCNEARLVEPASGQNFLSVLDPASQPYVVSVGGTTIDDATQPPAEHVWNDGAISGAGGGGLSESWPMPAWQRSIVNARNTGDIRNAEAFEVATASVSAPFTTPTFCEPAGATAGGTFCRETPDVSADADEFTGAVTIYGKNLDRIASSDGWTTIGGTSSSTPIWAATLALVNASSACAADKINGVQDAGFASPILYGIAASPIAGPASFHDVVSGNNDIDGLDNGLVFPARRGYDLASGLGSPHLTTAKGGPGLAFYMCDYVGQLHPPVVTGLSRSFGSTAGGYTVTISGSGFADVASVQVGAAQGPGPFTVTGAGSKEKLSLTFPPAVTSSGSPQPQDGAGPAPVIVTLKDGLSSAPSAASLFEYVDMSDGSPGKTAPSVTSVSAHGGIEGTTHPANVTIFGAGFTSGATVKFGGVAGTVDKIVSPFELEVTPPAFSALTPSTACPVDNGAAGQQLSPTWDVCQVEVTVTVDGQASSTAQILPPYEGAINFDSMKGEIVPAGCGCEIGPQPTEYDYVPEPVVTSVSTKLAVPSSLASEAGGSVVVVTGRGMDPLAMSYATLNTPGRLNENSIMFPDQESGTSMVLEAPPELGAHSEPTVQPEYLRVGFGSLVGQSRTRALIYAGIPVVTGVTNDSGLPGAPDTQACGNKPPASGCGTPLTIAGSGMDQVTGPLGFVDHNSLLSLGTQYLYTVPDDSQISTESVGQNPAVVDVTVCSVTGCSFNPPQDFLLIYPPGNPSIRSISLARGPAQGGTSLVINGSNLGCAVAVSFAHALSFRVSNVKALLDCGQTGKVDIVTPPGPAGQTVLVQIYTVESVLTSTLSNTVPFTYTPSAPSAPTKLAVTIRKNSATLTWRTPASDGGDPVDGYVVTARSKGQPGIRVRLSSRTREHDFSSLKRGKWTFSVVATSRLGNGLPATSQTISISH